MELIQTLAQELSIRPEQVKAAVELLDGGNTVPFIARYRKEATGSLDDGQLRDLAERLNYLRNLEKRREEIRSSIAEQNALTDELDKKIGEAATLAALEDLYLPYKKKRRTRASVAKERGLEPLADLYWEQTGSALPEKLAEPFVNEEKGVATIDDAIAGAKDIIAERISDDAAVRGALRQIIQKNAVLHSSAGEKDAGVYAMYADFTEPVAKIASYRVLAIDRGEREDVLKVSVECDRDMLLSRLFALTVHRGFSPSIDIVRAAAEDSLDRLIYPSLEREMRSALTERAAEQAIHVFALNLRPLLMQPPLRGRVVMGFDPAYRTGCKIAVVDPTGRVLDTTVVYPTPPQKKTEAAEAALLALIKKHNIDVISIGNGTASKESEIFVAGMLPKACRRVEYAIVSEAGASVYSASKLGAEEFPQYDVSLRSAVSIARRLQDPLAELVKIDPAAIGVGQYQHDMPPAKLNAALSGVVESCVNTVGVDVNTASPSLLSYVAGIGPALAKNIVAYREENGAFKNRRELLKVPKLGKKAFEQCAGFLRVPGGAEPLDNTGVHPESYAAAEKLLAMLGYEKKAIADGALSELPQRLAAENIDELAAKLSVGVPTLRDIAAELAKPGRDPRDELPAPELRSELLDISDLKPGMKLTGTVRNVVDFGAFVDIGVHQDGLVHISRICSRFLRHPSEAVAVGDIVTVRVLEVDPKRKRISLTMREDDEGK